MSYKYKAFISYRHVPKDIEIAKSIQSSIEHFHIPKSIKETYKIESLGKVFKGEELEMIKLDTLEGNVSIKGKINMINYMDSEGNKESSVFSKLFK